jgi:hypothetical protein
MVELYQTSGLAGKAKIADEMTHPPREPMTQESRQVELASQSVILKGDVVQRNSRSGDVWRYQPPVRLLRLDACAQPDGAVTYCGGSVVVHQGGEPLTIAPRSNLFFRVSRVIRGESGFVQGEPPTRRRGCPLPWSWGARWGVYGGRSQPSHPPTDPHPGGDIVPAVGERIGAAATGLRAVVGHRNTLQQAVTILAQAQPSPAATARSRSHRGHAPRPRRRWTA